MIPMARWFVLDVAEGRIYHDTPEGILRRIKGQSPFTKDMSLEEYLRFAAGNLETYHGVRVPADAQAILAAWERLGDIRILDREAGRRG